jgi:spore coat protein U-like protein
MQMMARYWMSAAVLCSLSSLPLPAHAALVCEADIPSMDFGLISGSDGSSPQTSSPVTVSCYGGTPGASVHACLTIGPGSGTSGAGLTPRYMTGGEAASLAYQLTSEDILSAGGTTWDMRALRIALDAATGSATVETTLYAEVASIGAQVTIGSYTSRFAAGTDVALSYGEDACDRSGATNTFTIDATVTPSCTISVSNMDFGVIDAILAAPVEQIATISVSCTHGSAYIVGLDHGSNAVDAGPTGRRMANEGDLLAYGLYHDNARLLDWGLAAGTVAAGTGSGANQALTVYGKIFLDQIAVVGTYFDSVVVIVSY